MDKIKISELVKALEEKSEIHQGQLGELVATMIINFGPDGRATPNIIEQSDTPLTMFMKIAHHYQDKIDRMMKNHEN